jgi:hypothetical protein
MSRPTTRSRSIEPVSNAAARVSSSPIDGRSTARLGPFLAIFLMSSQHWDDGRIAHRRHCMPGSRAAERRALIGEHRVRGDHHRPDPLLLDAAVLPVVMCQEIEDCGKAQTGTGGH